MKPTIITRTMRVEDNRGRIVATISIPAICECRKDAIASMEALLDQGLREARVLFPALPRRGVIGRPRERDVDQLLSVLNAAPVRYCDLLRAARGFGIPPSTAKRLLHRGLDSGLIKKEAGKYSSTPRAVAESTSTSERKGPGSISLTEMDPGPSVGVLGEVGLIGDETAKAA